MRRAPASPRRCAIAVCAALFAGAVCAELHAPITLEDLLDAEALGAVEFAPDGAHLAFARERPISQRASWGYDDAGQVGTRVFLAARDGGEARAIGAAGDARYSLLPERGWAPDGRGLLLLATTRAGYGLAYADLADAITVLPGRASGAFPVFDWIGDGRVVYAALADEAAQEGAYAQVAEGAVARWRAGWDGAAAPVVVSSESDAFATSVPPPGRLLLAAPRRAAAVAIADGDYVAVAVAPDARHLAAVRLSERIPESLNLAARRGELQLFRLDADGATLVRRYADLDVAERGGLAWSPSGKRLLIAAKPAAASRGAARLHEIDVASGARRELPAAGLTFVDPAAATLGGVLPIGWIGEQPAAVAARRQAAASAAPRSPGRLEARLEYGEGEDWRLDVYAFAGRAPENLTAFARTSVDRFLRPDGEARLLAIADGALWGLRPRRAPQRLSASDGPSVLAFGTDRRYPEPPPRAAYRRDGAGERVAIYGVEPGGAPRRFVLDLGSGRATALTGAGEIAATAPDQSTTVRRIADGWRTSLRLDGAGSRTLATVNAALAAKAVVEPERFDYLYEGRTLTGWMLRPPGSAADARLPALVSVYGGTVLDAPPRATQATIGPPVFSGQLLAAQGYAVVYPSTPLGAGADTDLMRTLAGETVAAIDALAARGAVDPRRVGLIGQSFGGYSVAAILAERSDRFRAGVAMAGIYDWLYAYGTRALAETLGGDGRMSPAEMTMVEIGQAQMAKPFWLDPAAYRRNSPIFRVERLDAPLLMLHGDMDMGVSGLPGAERMYGALVRAGKKPALVRYPGEGHVAQSAGAMRDQWQRVTAWFARYVKEPSKRLD